MYADSVKARRLIAPAAISKTSVGIIIGISLIFAIERLMTLYGDEQGILTVQKVLTATMLDPQQVLNGQYYRLVTYMLLHKDEFHLFVNMVGLYIFAKRAQNIFGTLPMLVIFVMSGIAGGVMHTFFDSQTLSIGASGGLMGIFGAVIVGTFRVRSQLPEALAKQQLKLMIVLAAFGLVLDHIIPQVATWVHIGGLICGVALGFMFPIGKNPEL
jgi:rhomboid protease GluP